MVMMQKCCALARVSIEFPRGPGALRVGGLRPGATPGHTLKTYPEGTHGGS